MKNCIGAKAQVSKKTKLIPPVRVYNQVKIKDGCNIGSYTHISVDTVIETNVSIGQYCAIASGVKIGVHPHPVNYLSSHPFQYNFAHFDFVDGYDNFERVSFKKPKKTYIGNDVWIGANVTIARGVIIGNGAIIAAHSFVKNDVEPFSIVGGTPAKHIKYRFDKDVRERIDSTEWWNFRPEWMKGVCFNDIEKSILRLEEIKINIISSAERKTFTKDELAFLDGNKIIIKCPEARVLKKEIPITKIELVNGRGGNLEVVVSKAYFDYNLESMVLCFDFLFPENSIISGLNIIS